MKIIREENKFTITDYKWDNKYSYGNYFRDDDHGPRTYKVGEKKVPSVTTILSATQSPEKKAGLDAWRERVGHQEAQRIMNQAATHIGYRNALRIRKLHKRYRILQFVKRGCSGQVNGS